MDAREVLQMAYDAVVKGDHFSLYALADSLEEAGMKDKATEIRNQIDKPEIGVRYAQIPSVLRYKVIEQDGDYDVRVYLEEMVRMAARNARLNGNKNSRSANGRVFAMKRVIHKPTHKTRRGKNELPLSALLANSGNT